MKLLLSFITTLLLIISAQAQTITQKGITYRYNGKKPRTFIGGVYIKPVSADNGVVSDEANGTFVMSLKNLQMGSRIGSVRVTKQGMMVFNQQAVEEWSVRKDPLCLILCDANEFQKQKKRLIAIGERQAQKKYDIKLAELKEMNEAQKLKIDDYYNKLDSLEKEYQNALKHMDEYADVFARIDESEIDTLAQHAIELFNNGDIEESISMFEKGNYMKKLDDALKIKAQAKELRQVADSVEILADRDINDYLRTINAQIAAYKLNNNFVKIGELLKGLADKINDAKSIWNYAYFCQDHIKYDEAEHYYLKYKELIENTKANEHQLANLYNNLAILYKETLRFRKSEDMYKEATEIYERLYKNDPQQYQKRLAYVYYWYGMSKYQNNKLHELVIPFERSLQLIKDVKEDKTDTLLYIKTLSNLVDFNALDKNYANAYKYNKELLPLLKDQYNKNTESWALDYLCKLIVQSSLSNRFGKFIDGEKYALEAIELDSSQIFTSHYHCLAYALLFQGKVDEAEKLFRQFKDEYKDTFILVLTEFERLGVIPEERKADVERIKAILNE